MSDAVNLYFLQLADVINLIKTREGDKIRRVGKLAAESISAKGLLHIYDTGHMLTSELIGRAGGLLSWTPLTFSINVHNPTQYRDAHPGEQIDDHADAIHLALRRSKLTEGDILFVGSVSGKSFNPVEVAIQARKLGVTVIGVTSVQHSKVLASEHPSGKRLFEVCDIVLDNHAPPGDAMVAIPDFDKSVCPASGMAAACLLWGINACAVEELVKQGVEPSVYSSVNLPGGPENVRRIQERFTELGY